MISKSKIFEVYESQEKRRQLYTVNLVPGSSVYGERLVKEDGFEYREWDASKSKLAATILKGSPNIGIRKNDVILYLGATSGTLLVFITKLINFFLSTFYITFRIIQLSNCDFIFYIENKHWTCLAEIFKPTIIYIVSP